MSNIIISPLSLNELILPPIHIYIFINMHCYRGRHAGRGGVRSRYKYVPKQKCKLVHFRYYIISVNTMVLIHAEYDGLIVNVLGFSRVSLATKLWLSQHLLDPSSSPSYTGRHAHYCDWGSDLGLMCCICTLFISFCVFCVWRGGEATLRRKRHTFIQGSGERGA